MHPRSHLLLVEDDASHAELVRRAFASLSEFRLTIAPSVASARGLLANFAPDLVIADLNLPDGRGIDLVPPSGCVGYPVIIMTSQGGEAVAVEAMKAGALDYVVKSEATFERMPDIAARALADWGMVTERKRSELELAQREREVRDAQKMEALGRLASGIAHDFNNVLMGIIGCADVALAKLPPSTEGRSYIAELKRSAVDAAGTARRLLAFSRGDAEIVTVELDTAVKALEATLHVALGPEIALVLTLDAQDARAKLAAGELEQMLVSLAINARDAMPRGGRLTISTRRVAARTTTAMDETHRAPSEVMLSVSDTGVGMDAATRERALEPFFTTKGAGKGTGLGLSSVYGFVTRSGGRLELKSAVGVGTSVSAYLPLAAATLAAGAAQPVRPTPASATILLAEDDDLIRASLRHYLVRAGHAVLETSSAEQAQRYVDDVGQHIDFLLSDVAMPGRSGADLVRHARRRRPGMAMALMSGHARRGSHEPDSLPEGVPLLRKPFTEAELLKLVHAALNAEVEPAATPTRRLDPHDVTTESSPSHLSSPLVLLVEDDALCRLASHELLVEAGFRVLDAATPSRARELFVSSADVDVLVTDLGLPECTGFQLATELRTHRPGLSVVIVSGRHKSDPEVVEALRLPRTSFVQKPIEITSFALTIRALVAKAHREDVRGAAHA